MGPFSGREGKTARADGRGCACTENTGGSAVYVNRTDYRRRLVTCLILAGLFVCAQGCTYLHNRGNDAKDMIDLGFTFSNKPKFAAFYDFVPVIPIGYGDVQGHFVGLGGGQFSGWAPHYEQSYGAILWGQEKVNFGTSQEDLDAMGERERNKALSFQRTGLAGMVQGPFPGSAYLISCPHYLHLGWVGIVATPRYLHMLDFIAGWTTLDICGDDNRADRRD